MLLFARFLGDVPPRASGGNIIKLRVALLVAIVFLTSACNHDDKPTPSQPNQESERIAFVYDVSRSTTSWQTDMKWSTLHLLDNIDVDEFSVDFYTMDAHGGSQNCTAATNVVSGEDGPNDEVVRENRDKGLRSLRLALTTFLNCEADASLDIGTDLQLQNLSGYDRVVIMTDGFLLTKQEPVINFSRDNLDNPSTSIEQIDNYLAASPANLMGVRVEVYGLGFRANLSSAQGNNLHDAWRYLLEKVNAEVVAVQEKMP